MPPTRVAMVWNAELKQKSDELVHSHLERFRGDLQSTLENHRRAIEQRLCAMTDQVGRLTKMNLVVDGWLREVTLLKGESRHRLRPSLPTSTDNVRISRRVSFS